MWKLEAYSKYQLLRIRRLSQPMDTPRDSHSWCSIKNVVLNNFEKVLEKPMRQSLLQVLASNFLKKGNLAQVFSCFTERPRGNSFCMPLLDKHLAIKYFIQTLALNNKNIMLCIEISMTNFHHHNCYQNQSIQPIIEKVLKLVYFVGLNPFQSSVTFLYPLKTSENLWFSDVFRGYRNVTLD